MPVNFYMHAFSLLIGIVRKMNSKILWQGVCSGESALCCDAGGGSWFKYLSRNAPCRAGTDRCIDPAHWAGGALGWRGASVCLRCIIPGTV